MKAKIGKQPPREGPFSTTRSIVPGLSPGALPLPCGVRRGPFTCDFEVQTIQSEIMPRHGFYDYVKLFYGGIKNASSTPAREPSLGPPNCSRVEGPFQKFSRVPRSAGKGEEREPPILGRESEFDEYRLTARS